MPKVRQISAADWEQSFCDLLDRMDDLDGASLGNIIPDDLWTDPSSWTFEEDEKLIKNHLSKEYQELKKILPKHRMVHICLRLSFLNERKFKDLKELKAYHDKRDAPPPPPLMTVHYHPRGNKLEETREEDL